MNNILKKEIIFGYFLLAYIYVLFGHLTNYNYFLIVLFLYNIYLYVRLLKKIVFSIILKVVVFNLFMIYFIIFERILTIIFLCGMDGEGFLQRIGLINHSCSNFSLYENILLNFISSLYYPIYIFIFFKPFVNHLDKSIRKIKEDRYNK